MAHKHEAAGNVGACPCVAETRITSKRLWLCLTFLQSLMSPDRGCHALFMTDELWKLTL